MSSSDLDFVYVATDFVFAIDFVFAMGHVPLFQGLRARWQPARQPG